eukprot:SAG25_NODE_33_length_20262_cov_33.203293_34_plen_43_part_00
MRGILWYPSGTPCSLLHPAGRLEWPRGRSSLDLYWYLMAEGG